MTFISTDFTQLDEIFLSPTGRVLANQSGVSVSQSTPQTLHLSNRASQAAYQAILAEIFFQNLEDEPTNLLRTVEFFITDDEFNNTATTTVQILLTNDPAFLSFTMRTLVFNETTRTPVSLFEPTDNITDSDGQTLQWLSIEITPTYTMDMLLGDSLDTGLSLEVTATDTGNILLNVSGEANHSTYERVLQSISFVNDFPGINTTRRLVQVITFDGTTTSPPHEIFIAVDQFDDDPMCFFNTLVRSSSLLPNPTLSPTPLPPPLPLNCLPSTLPLLPTPPLHFPSSPTPPPPLPPPPLYLLTPLPPYSHSSLLPLQP